MSAPSSCELVQLDPAGTQQIQSLPILILNAHSRCNCRCIMCDIWKTAERRSLSESDLRPHLDSIRRLGVRQIVFSGGEPLMNPGLWPLCSMLRAGGIRLTLLSTGLLFHKHAAAIAGQLDEAIVSLDGPPEIHDRIRGVRGAFQQLHHGIAAVRHHSPGFPISGRTTVQRANFRELRRTVVSARLLQLDSISFLAADLTSQAFNRAVPWSRERQADVAGTSLEINALKEEIDELVEQCASAIHSGFIREDGNKLRRIVSHFRAHAGLCEPEAPRCNAPWVSAVVETDGSVRPCFFQPAIGNLQDGTLEQVLNGSKAVAFRERLDIDRDPICRRCVCSLQYQGPSPGDSSGTRPGRSRASLETQGARPVSSTSVENGMRDQIFKTAQPVGDFKFDASVAAVFDDMLERSIPFYGEVQRMVVELADRLLGEDGTFYDIGCSTGNTICELARSVGTERRVRFVGLEPSHAMRDKVQEKLAALPAPQRFEILPHSIEAVEELPGARVISLLYTLQFVRPMHRLKVLQMCHRSLQPGGCLILAEKVLAERQETRHLFIDLYHQYKARSGYTAMEIARKREALENVLIPFMASEDIALLKEAGFSAVEPFFQWYNFAAFLALK
jgi:Fe-coproporphyrin III synthase